MTSDHTNLQPPAGGTVITWTRPMLQRFKVAHANALCEDKTEFTFDGNEFVVGYAKYLIQYLEGVLK